MVKKSTAETPMETELVAVSSLTLDPRNARKHDKGIPELIASLQAFGQRKNLVVWHDVVIAGNGLLEAAKSLGWQDIVIARVPDEWTYEQAQAFALADNKTAELSSWDLPLLREIRLDLDANGWDTEQFGFVPLAPPDVVEDTTPQLTGVAFAVIVECDTEQDQLALLERFEKEGLKSRPLMM